LFDHDFVVARRAADNDSNAVNVGQSQSATFAAGTSITLSATIGARLL